MDSKALAAFSRGIAFVRREVNSDLPIQQIAILLRVAEQEGVTMPEIAQSLKMSQASVSKNVRMLSRFVDGTEIKGYDLLRAEQSIENRLRLALTLTAKGAKVLKGLAEIMGARREP
jgi:DNA-binding MarR family transcriptional regulator